MVIDFSNIDYKNKPVLILRNLDGIAIQTLGYAFNIAAEFSYNEISTLTFDLPKQIDGINTPHYDDVVGMRIIDLHNVGQFILINPSEESDGVKTVKSCTAYSLEYEFAKKTITLESGTYNFWNPLSPDDTILGRILERMPDWSVGKVDSDLIGIYRTFEVTEENIYDFMKSVVQEPYGCIFEFDTYKREINVVSVNSKVEQKPVYLSTERLIKEVEINEDSDNIVTCLDVNGADGVTIRSVNPTGTNKIYNLDYFMNTTNFSEGFIQKWRQWEKDYEAYRTIYYNTSIERNLQTVRKLTEQSNLTDLKGELTDLENQQAATIQAIAENLAEQSALKIINKNIADKKTEISEQENKIKNINNILTGIENTLDNIKSALAWNKQDTNGNYVYFTPDELNILQKYFIENSVQDSSFVISSTATYDNKDINNPINNIKLAVTDSSNIESVTDDNGKVLKNIKGGELSVGLFKGEIVNATVDFNTDKSFIFTASLIKGKAGETEFNSGNITVIGNYKTTSSSTSSLSFNVYDGTLYFTKNATEYEQHMIEWELYEYGRQVLAEKSSPAYDFSIQSGNFLAADDFISFKNELALGKRVYLKIDDNDVLTPYVVKVSINYEDASDFNLEFSSTYTTFDQQFSLSKLLEQSVSMGKTLNAKSGIYEQFVSSGASNTVKEFMDSALDIAKNTVLSSGHQAIEFGDAGIRVRKWDTDSGNPPTEYEPEEIWIVDNMIAFTDDKWNTAKMAIGKIYDDNIINSDGTKGGRIYGIAAPYLVGTILAGQNLIITTENGSFNVDSSGVVIDSLNMRIINSSGSGLTFDANEGLKHTVTVNGTKYEAGFSASNNNDEGYGLYFMVDGKKKLYFDVDKPELVVDGSIWAREIYLGKDRKNINALTVNDKGYDAIQGNCLDLKNILVKDDDGNKRFEIDGNGRYFRIYNGYIYLTNGKNTIKITPSEGLIFTSDGAEKLKLDISNGNVTSNDGTFTGGIFRATGQGRDGGAAYYIQDGYRQCGYISYDSHGAGTAEEARERVFFTTTDGVALKLQSSGNMSFESNGGNIYFTSSVNFTGSRLKWNNETLATQNTVENEIKSLRTWVENNFAKKSDIPSGI